MPRFFCSGQLAGLDHEVHARNIDGRRLLDERVLARLDGRLQVSGPEMRRRGQDHVVDLGDLQQLL